MSVLVVGGDRLDAMKDFLGDRLGADRIAHYSGRKLKLLKNGIPKNVDLMIVLTDYINHDLMKAYKNIARKKEIPFVCTHSVSHFRNCLGSMKYCFV